MLLPQSSAFAALKNRLNSVSAIGYLHIAPRTYVPFPTALSYFQSRDTSMIESMSSFHSIYVIRVIRRLMLNNIAPRPQLHLQATTGPTGLKGVTTVYDGLSFWKSSEACKRKHGERSDLVEEIWRMGLVLASRQRKQQMPKHSRTWHDYRDPLSQSRTLYLLLQPPKLRSRNPKLAWESLGDLGELFQGTGRRDRYNKAHSVIINV